MEIKKLSIGIIGTRGIPNRYGGFEQFAEFLSVGLVEKGHQVSVYSPHNHAFLESTYKGVSIIHIYDPEYKWGTKGQFVYDFNCIKDSRSRNFDIILQLGYTSSAIFWWLFSKNSVVITNMDGLEWMRSKFSESVKRFLKFSERLAAKHSQALVADSLGIQAHLKKKYGVDSSYIPYGAVAFENPEKQKVVDAGFNPNHYFLVIARIEPENNVETIIKGYLKTNSTLPLIIVGGMTTPFAAHLKSEYGNRPQIKFVGGIYDQNLLDNLRFYSAMYFHGHSVGGTNPSLLEAMASSAYICANENSFNRAILNDEALYFKNDDDVAEHVNQFSVSDANRVDFIDRNFEKIKSLYTWESIINHYEELFLCKIN